MTVVNWTTIMTSQHKVSNRFTMILRQYFFDCEKVVERLGHLFLINLNITKMHPGIYKLLTRSSLRLRNFILMMWKHKIQPTPMNVYMFAHTFMNHSRALYMPAWTSLTPRRIPGWFTWLSNFP